jgi:hypothetical protein
LNKQERAKIRYEQNHKIEYGIEYKKCRQCGIFKPMTKEFYHRSKIFKDGYIAICKQCVKEPEKRISKHKGLNDYIVNGDTTTLFLDNEAGEIRECYIDTEDLQMLIDLDYRWFASYYKNIDGYYAKTIVYSNGSSTPYYLHKLIIGNKDGREYQVHHKEQKQTLDNRKSNLEIVTSAVNSQLREGANKNSSTGVRNVNRSHDDNILWVQFLKNGKRYKWEFPIEQFEEACEFARLKRIELFGAE